MKRLFNVLILTAIFVLISMTVSTQSISKDENTVLHTIPVAANSYTTQGSNVAIPRNTSGGITLSDQSSVVSLYFKVSKPGPLHLEMTADSYAQNNTGVVKVSALGKTYNIKIEGADKKEYIIGLFDVETPGYIKVDFQGVSKIGTQFARIYKLTISGEATTGKNTYISEAQLTDWNYWGRRGPSVHMKYEIGTDAEYFYNEFTVPQGSDVVGSYYMTNGFSQGYFGFQVNSPTERRVLFSVWSPFETDKPSEIPADMQVINSRKGDGVHVGAFGNEGSGGQSYLKFMWETGVTYKALVQIKRYGRVSTSCPYITEYTGYFFDPQQDKWILIASWRRPDTSYKSYTGAYSFLENFNPENGWQTREVYFGNQWTCNSDGKWTEITSAKFSYDATARAEVRVDYYGGMKNNMFVLKNCGFFDVNSQYGIQFVRNANSIAPNIDLEALKLL